MKIEGSRLTTCSVGVDGETIRLDLEDRDGTPVSLQLPFEQAQAVAMTLPRLLSRALRLRSGDVETRYVFPLGHASVEIGEQGMVIVTFGTIDGFEVSFAMRPEQLSALSGETIAGDEPPPRIAPGHLN